MEIARFLEFLTPLILAVAISTVIIRAASRMLFLATEKSGAMRRERVVRTSCQVAVCAVGFATPVGLFSRYELVLIGIALPGFILCVVATSIATLAHFSLQLYARQKGIKEELLWVETPYWPSLRSSLWALLPGLMLGIGLLWVSEVGFLREWFWKNWQD